MSVSSIIRQIIKDNGYITVDEMMRIAMSDLESSYYRSSQPLGEDADFITAPEISQMFGEMIGIWALCAWDNLGRPDNVNLIELGPGRGALMRDLLRSTSHVQDFHNALNISLCEINPILMQEQSKNLKPYNKDISYISKVSEIGNDFSSILIANEFFDALPIKQYVKLIPVSSLRGNASNCEELKMTKQSHDSLDHNENLGFSGDEAESTWHERVIDLDQNGDFKWNHIKSTNLFKDHINARKGAILEESEESIAFMRDIEKHLEERKGASLIIDYGYNLQPDVRTSTQYNSTLQAIKNHKFHDVFEDLGSADISAHVDFDALRRHLRGNKVDALISSSFGGSHKNLPLPTDSLKSYIITQKELLQSLGIDVRLRNLIDKNRDLAQILTNQYNRLISDSQMGLLFKALILESF